jgi:hypothetical protein
MAASLNWGKAGPAEVIPSALHTPNGEFRTCTVFWQLYFVRQKTVTQIFIEL